MVPAPRSDMAKPQSARLDKLSSGHWDSLSDDELLRRELTTDDPENLDGLVYELPLGDEESHIEFSYDFSKSGRTELRCVHGNHGHLRGFVVNKGGRRFL